MDAEVARSIAQYSHRDERTRRGAPRIEHVERVAAAVPKEARSVAYLHEVLEHTVTDGDELLAHGLTECESAALALLTRTPAESFEQHVLRIVHAPGREGWLARMVKLADLDDHIRQNAYEVGDPPYAWARRHVVAGQSRRDAPAPRLPAAAGSGGDHR